MVPIMNPRILNKKNLLETRYLNMVSTTYADKHGKPGTWISAERPGNQNAVVIVAILPDRPSSRSSLMKEPLLVITREFRVPIQGYEWGLPAGLIDPGMSIEETAVKELKEETGLDVVRFIRPVTPFVYNSPGMTNEAVSFAFVEATGEISKEIQDPEDIATYLYSRPSTAQLLEDAADPRSNILIGAKAWLIFNTFVRYGSI